MEITNELKSFLLAPYFNVKGAWGGENESPDSIGYMLLDLEDKSYSEVAMKNATRYWKVKLKPLSSISNEDGIEFANILYKEWNKGNWSVNRENMPIIWMENELNSDHDFCFDEGCVEIGHPKIESNQIFFAYQYLQSKGYDLQQHLLSDKTLKEAGLVTYE